MYELKDTIAAVSSPAVGQRVIVRISGPNTIAALRPIFNLPVSTARHQLLEGHITVDGELKIAAKVYLFLEPYSYTGETLAEIHIHTNPEVVETLMGGILGGEQVRLAGPGEFTARAYLNGKIDLSQAEAVGEIVASSNRLQLAAAEKLLAGRLTQNTEKICTDIMDCLSLIEAGLDFSSEDIEFISESEATEKISAIQKALEELFSGSISYESVIDLPAAGIAGAPNAGKSSLLNALLGQSRSIVSEQRKTTRDILNGLLGLSHNQCVLFDCAGLISEPGNILDKLAQQAAIEALHNASVVVFCVDASDAGSTEWSEDISVRSLIAARSLLPVATKTDLLSEEELAERLERLKNVFGVDFMVTSAKTGDGLNLLRDAIDRELLRQAAGSAEQPVESFSEGRHHFVALTSRHKQAVTEAIENVAGSIQQLKAGNEEVAAMMLRAGFEALSNIEQQPVDEQILEKVFGRFCIGK